MFVLGTNWTTWHPVVGEQIGKISHQKDRSLWQTISSFDFKHSSHKWLPTILSCGLTRLSIVDWVYSKTQILLVTLKTRNQPQVWVLCIFGSRPFVQISWICKKQTSVSHSSTELEIVSLDAGLRMDGLPALDLGDIVIEVLRSTNNTVKPGHDGIRETCAGQNPKTKTPTDKRKQKVDQLSDVDYVPTNTKRTIKGRSPTMRHVSRTHRDALDWLFDRVNLEPQIRIEYVETKNQLADIFSMFSCNHFSDFLSDPIGKQSAMSKRGQEVTSGEGSPMTKPRRKRDHSNWYHAARGTTKTLHRIWCIWSPENADERKEVEIVTGKPVQTASK